MSGITNYGAFTSTTAGQIYTLLQQGATIAGNSWYVDPANGQNTNSGTSPTSAFQTLAQAHAAATAGNNDTVYLIGNGATSGTARLTATFTWSKAATHLVGISSGVTISSRARIAPTSTATAFTPFFTISASGCHFANVQWFCGFGTGTTSAIGVAISGGRNRFDNCHFAGIADTASAGSAGSRSVKITTTGENEFYNCVFGIDTVSRGAANATLEFGGVGNPRNYFEKCLFPFECSAATPLGIIVSAAAASDRYQLFRDCVFINGVNSTSTTMTALCTLAASIGGMIVLKGCTCVGMTDLFSDATTAAQMWIDGAAPTTTTTGLAVHPA